MGLDSIVNVNITAETAAVTQAGFGTPLVLGEEFDWPERVRYYASTAAMIEDGFDASDASVKAVGAILSQNPKVPRVLVGMRSADESVSLADDILAIQVVNSDWYGLVLAESDAADIEEAAATIESMRKLFAATSDEAAILDPASTTDLASKLNAKGYARTFLLYGNPEEHGAAAWMGAMFPKDPGSASWKFKSLRGVSVSKLSAAGIATLQAKNCNYYRELAGASITAEGVTPSGEFIDITHGLDWLQARLQEDIYGLLVRTDKVPYTDAGVAMVENLIRARLQVGIGIGLLAEDPAPTVSVPKVRDVPQNDRANRHLPDLRFSAVLAGAIHSLTINGTVSV